MLHKTRGIIFKNTRYSETSIIVKVYTEKFGLQTYIVNGIRKATSKSKAGIYQHGNILDMVVYYRETGDIFRISEAKIAAVYNEIPFDIVKGSLLLFYLEVMNKVIREEESNPELFGFIENTLLHLDTSDQSLANHHFYFLLDLSRHLGFRPAVSAGRYFHLQEGYFDDVLPRSSYFIDDVLSAKLKLLLDQKEIVRMSAAERKTLLHHLLVYFRLHVTDFGELRSPAILEELFRN